MSIGFLQLQALLVVARIGGSFGGSGDECFGEGKRVDWFGMENADRWVVKGRSGMCLAVYDGRGVNLSAAMDACAASFHGGMLLSNDSWDDFAKAIDDYSALSVLTSQMFVGFSPQREKGCYYVMDVSQKSVKLKDPCDNKSRGFVCEYQRQEKCRWEMMTEETATKGDDNQWRVKTVVVQLQEIDGSKESCKPADLLATISDKLAACKPLFNETWSEWSDCGSCGNQGLQGNQSRHQDLTDICNKIGSGVQRNHTRTCIQVPCSSTHVTTTATSEGEGGPQFATLVAIFGSLFGVVAIATTVVICCRYKGGKKKNKNISAGFEADSTSRGSGSVRGRSTRKEQSKQTRTRTKTTTREETSPVRTPTPKRHHSPAPPKPSAPKPKGGKGLGEMAKKVAQPKKIDSHHYETIVVVPEEKGRKGREKKPVQSDKYETIAGFGEMPAAKTGLGDESRTALVVAGKELERKIEQQEESLFRRADEVKGLKIKMRQLQERMAKNTKK